MKTTAKIELLVEARNLLHAQEEGKEVSPNDIVRAHDLVDMVLDALVDEDFNEKMEEAHDAMTEPQIEVSDEASCEQCEYIEKINFALNGVSYRLEEPMWLSVEDGSFFCEHIEYALGTLVATRYNHDEDNWSFVRLDAVKPVALDALYAKIIAELY